jgi:two-component system response regulator VicR
VSVLHAVSESADSLDDGEYPTSAIKPFGDGRRGSIQCRRVAWILARQHCAPRGNDPGLRELLRAALTSAGFVVVAVEDGLDALRRLEHMAPEAVVLDLALPRMDGRDVSRELRARSSTRHILIVVVSGTDMQDLDPSDFACLLRKPIDPDVVVFEVERSLRRSRRPESAV